MTSFDGREKNFEAEFKLDEEQRFRVKARAVRLMGLWAAQQIGLSGADAEAYADQVVEADFEEAGNDDFLGKIRKDFGLKGMDVTLHHLENQFVIHLEEARKSLFPA